MTPRIRLLSALLSERGILALLVASQLFAFLYSLIISGPFWQSLGLVSLFIHFTSFLSLTILVVIRRFVETRSDLVEAGILILVFVMATALTSWFFPYLFTLLGWIDEAKVEINLWRNIAMCLCIMTIFAHFLAIFTDNIRKVEALSRAELEALQARIRPHFLYNTLNTVAELIHLDPSNAEKSALALADLSRAAMSTQSVVRLDDEIQMCKAYLDLERWRFAERLRDDWILENIIGDERIPALILQPLVENAVSHAVEPNPSGADIKISIHRAGRILTIVIANSYNPTLQPTHQGHGIGLSNIQRRLALYYEPSVDFEVNASEDSFTVSICIPL
ncbi:sensor histidine kinase [Pseudoalteromonas peptidolytica]|uniref:Two-component system, LytT family, sensor histidine kinase AlgZ n=1 Tax=Pseudoalteromonas peptidolytica F12-50-A1 TaxID=1315280 RepID=A0A8I0MUY2_9GAMM|nr:histidine kinase [Pseudoalteromonas peptidolytica]MBE0345730.1 two-component system, LytT family, sensor histidine kinase AlgZ [Pseudoalteromonas peptidolytica F12-50-A1]NLR14347.1 GHKL domain-containing protein [Pseudoalteromonas peptidolytica]GEK07904.1 alginate biosynthesis protein [Pseudoalteromonas peptidolytica]